jgi:hypothetical protein
MKYVLKLIDASFEIKREPQGLWDLWVNGMPTLTFATPQDAARAVHQHQTGWSIWDSSESLSAPDGLAGWSEVP